MDDYEIKSIEAALEKREEAVFDWGIWTVSCRLAFVREHGHLARVACCVKHPKRSYSEYEYSRNLPHSSESVRAAVRFLLNPEPLGLTGSCKGQLLVGTE
jgi:hypothetical protein